MQGYNHIAGGLVFTGLFSSFHDVNIFEKPEYLALTVAASLLPDIDHPGTLIGRLFYPLAKFISTKVGHRTFTHSVFFWLGIVALVRIVELAYASEAIYSVIVFYAILSHDVFDMVTKTGVAFFYPFSTRPCVLPGNPDMRMRTSDIRAEGIVFVVFSCLLFTCQSLFAKGFWQTYNQAFSTFSHIDRETKRKNDYLNITFLDPKKDSVAGMFVGAKDAEFYIFNESGFLHYPKTDCKFLTFEHSGKVRKPQEYAVIDVSLDSIRKHLRQNFIKMELQSSVEMYYRDGALQKSGKIITIDYIKGFDFFLSPQIDNPSDHSDEIEILLSRIRNEESRFNRELDAISNEISQLQGEYNQNEREYNYMSDYEKGLWVKKRQNINSDIKRLQQERSRKIPPNLETDYIRLRYLQEKSQTPKEPSFSGSFVVL